ncbi:NitT/TauT family transport system permease protein [Tistlia consotensis]|uniref:NitT/TauT family transport system permease protein n=1 Tax=Tistlia consotensis USBA 355 TaxID=560819 RepID=A0A1Y6BYH6_9PROT|nr:ABC transporter permease [Tistlia consotensis]SMF36135.1 NitT/TauT family transport system permease protein [Tistlia consotensis USBA 355]SNR71489.1 NitT/TauT family transport system permease protein [Tistlia consotensis]
MRRIINYHPDRLTGLLLAMLPFVLLIAAYAVGSQARLAENADDKLMPAFATFVDAMSHLAFEPNRRTGEYVFWTDTLVSLQRLGLGLGISTLLCIVIGVPIGLIPYLQQFLNSFMAAFSLIPPLAVLPILFIIFGLGETSKIVLIVFGIAPFMIRDVTIAVTQIPREQLIKAQTLNASTWQMMTQIVFPQVLPRLYTGLRLGLGAAWLFLIAAEAIASEGGLGYRIFLVRRYLSMEIILPYVAWITFLAFAMDFALDRLSRWTCRWHHLAS